MKDLFLDFLKGLLMGICFIVLCLILASVSSSVYSKTVHPHGESVLTDCKPKGAYSPNRAFFVCVLPLCVRIFVMQAVRGGHLRVCWLPFVPVCQPTLLACANHLTVMCRLPKNTKGAH